MPNPKTPEATVHFPYQATVISGRKNPNQNPFNFRRNKELRNFDPSTIVLPFKLDLVRVMQHRDTVADEGQFEVAEIQGVYARQLIELEFGKTKKFQPEAETPEYHQQKIVIAATVVGRLSLEGTGNNQSRLYSALVTNFRSLVADDYLFSIMPPHTGHQALSEPIPPYISYIL